MPPFQNRSTGAFRMAVISSFGRQARPRTPSARRTSGQSGIDFADARPNAAARADQAPVVIVPARARQVEQALALGEGARRVGIGVQEDVAMVEGRHAA